VLAGASPAASGNRVLAAGSDVQFYLLAPGLASAPGQPDKNALVEVHPEMGLPLASDFALETADRVAPVATRQPGLVAEAVNRPVAHLAHGEAITLARQAPLQLETFGDHLIRLAESTRLEQLAQQICTRCEYKHWEHSLTRSLPCPPPAVQRFTDTAGEHQCGRAVMVCPDGSFGLPRFGPHLYVLGIEGDPDVTPKTFDYVEGNPVEGVVQYGGPSCATQFGVAPGLDATRARYVYPECDGRSATREKGAGR